MPEYIHPKAVNAALQPEAQNVQHFLGDFGIAPVEVGLFAQEGMVVVLPRMRVVFPSASTKARQPVIRRPAARARAAPDIPVALGAVPRQPQTPLVYLARPWRPGRAAPRYTQAPGVGAPRPRPHKPR